MTVLIDQAEGLRRALVGEYVHTILIACAHSQTGEFEFISDLVGSFAANSHQVLIIDLSRERGQLSEALHVYPRYDLLHFVEEKASLEDVICPVAPGVLLLQASRGLDRLAGFPPVKHQEWITRLKTGLQGVQFVLVYTGLMISDAALRAADACQECLLLSSTEKIAVTSAYVWLKSIQHRRREFWVYLNHASSYGEAKKVFDNMAFAARNFLDVRLKFAGAASDKEGVDALVESIADWPCPKEAAVSLSAFLQRLCLSAVETRAFHEN